MKVKIKDIKIRKRYRKEFGDIGSLKESIGAVGLLHPIVVSKGMVLVAGRRRLKAVKELGWTEIPVTVVDLERVADGEREENVCRLDFQMSEITAIYEDALKNKEKGKAQERQKKGKSEDGTAGGRGKKAKPSVKLTEGLSGEAKNKAAKGVGKSRNTMEKAVAIIDAAEENPERFGELVEEMDRTGKVAGVYKKLKIEETIDELAKEKPPLPTGPFRVIVIDPPWEYTKRAKDPTHRSANPYPQMTIDEIKVLDIQSIAHKDSILWLWTTNAHIPYSFEIVKHWGFEYKTLLTWSKGKMGMGDWLRGKSEHCLMCVRGKPKVKLTNQTTILSAQSREHSRKPDGFYSMVEELCPGSKVDIFAREQRKGWTCHGIESELFS